MQNTIVLAHPAFGLVGGRGANVPPSCEIGYSNNPYKIGLMGFIQSYKIASSNEWKFRLDQIMDPTPSRPHKNMLNHYQRFAITSTSGERSADSFSPFCLLLLTVYVWIVFVPHGLCRNYNSSIRLLT